MNRTFKNIFIYLKPRNIIYLRLHTGDKPYENSQIDKDFCKKMFLYRYSICIQYINCVHKHHNGTLLVKCYNQ